MWISRSAWLSHLKSIQELYKKLDSERECNIELRSERDELRDKLSKALKGNKTSVATETVPTGSFYGVNF